MNPLTHTVPPDGDESPTSRVVHRRVEVTIDRELLSIEYLPPANVSGWCPQCGKNVLLITAEAAAAAHGTSPRAIYRRLDDNEIHFQESPLGTVFICSESLDKAPKKELP